MDDPTPAPTLVYEFTPEERAAIKRRQDAVIHLLNTIAEIHQLPGELTIGPELKGLYTNGKS